MCQATNNTVDHVNEIRTRLNAVMSGAEAFLPLIASLERELVRCEEDILPMRRGESRADVMAHVDGMQQRHRSLGTAAAELRRQVNHIFVVAEELAVVQRPFLDAACQKPEIPVASE